MGDSSLFGLVWVISMGLAILVCEASDAYQRWLDRKYKTTKGKTP